MRGAVEVGFKTRERKRRRRAAVKGKVAAARNQRGSRRTGSAAGSWWLTLATSKCCCAQCATILKQGSEIVYRRELRETRCVRCAGRLEDSKGYRPSLRWEKAKRGRVSSGM
jgi:hypothetical protein